MKSIVMRWTRPSLFLPSSCATESVSKATWSARLTRPRPARTLPYCPARPGPARPSILTAASLVAKEARTVVSVPSRPDVLQRNPKWPRDFMLITTVPVARDATVTEKGKVAIQLLHLAPLFGFLTSWITDYGFSFIYSCISATKYKTRHSSNFSYCHFFLLHKTV